MLVHGGWTALLDCAPRLWQGFVFNSVPRTGHGTAVHDPGRGSGKAGGRQRKVYHREEPAGRGPGLRFTVVCYCTTISIELGMLRDCVSGNDLPDASLCGGQELSATQVDKAKLNVECFEKESLLQRKDVEVRRAQRLILSWGAKNCLDSRGLVGLGRSRPCVQTSARSPRCCSSARQSWRTCTPA